MTFVVRSFDNNALFDHSKVKPKPNVNGDKIDPATIDPPTP